jgi:hypothetical protein
MDGQVSPWSSPRAARPGERTTRPTPATIDLEVRQMDITRRHTLAVTGATLALVMASTAVVAANGGVDDRGGRGFGSDRPGGLMRGDGPGFPGLGGRLGPGLGLGVDGLVRSETTVDLGEAGFLTRRIDDGTVTSASDAELTYTLATGESATVSADEDTEVLAVSEASEDDSGMFRRRMVSLDEIALADIPADSDVIVWSEAGEGGAFVAQRVIVRQAEDATTEDASTEAADEATPSGAATAEVAPSASPEV